MRKIVHKIAVFCVSVANADYIGKLPSAITLTGGASQTHNAVMDCSSYWECVFGDESQSFTYTTRGNGDSSLTLKATLPPNPQSKDKSKPFFIGTMIINPHSNLTMSDFESFNLGRSLTINGGSLIFGNGDFATRYNTNIAVTNGGKLGIVGKGFTNRGTMSAQNATISIIPTSAWNQGTISNENGEMTIGTNLLNIGQRGTLADTFSSVAHITNSGKLTIEGNLQNGGQENPNIMCQVGGCGGGSIANHGGIITIKGSLISEPKDGQSSAISIYGGSMSVANGVENRSGSTLTIGAKDGVMGKIQGNVNNGGDFIIDALNASAGNHTLITGNFTGNAPSLKNGNSDFTSATLTNGNKTLEVKINQDGINAFKSTLNENQSATLGAFGDRIFSVSGASSANLKATANAINTAIFSAFYATPLAMMDSANDHFATHTPKMRRVAKRKITKTQMRKGAIRQNSKSRQTRKIAQRSANPNDINAEMILQGIAANDANGVLGRVVAGYGRDFANARFALNFAYTFGTVWGATNGEIATHKTRTQSHNFALNSNIEARFTRDFGFDLGISGVSLLVNSTREVKSNALNLDSSLKSAQKFYQITLDSALFYNFNLGNFGIMPYLGLNQGYIAMPKFAETSTFKEFGAFSGNSAFALSAESYNAYFLNALLGVKSSIDFGEYGAILTDLEYKFLALKTQKQRVFHYANSEESLKFIIPNAHKISLDLGYHKDFNRWYLRVQGNFGAMLNASKSSDTNANFYIYGISAKFGYLF